MNDNITIYSINGPVVKVKNADDLKMQETVYVGNKRLIGEVISNSRGEVTIQVYESTTGLKTGEPIVRTGKPMSVTLAPGIIGNIFDGIERPLKALESISSPYIETGCDVELVSLISINDYVKDNETIYRFCFEAKLKDYKEQMEADDPDQEILAVKWYTKEEIYQGKDNWRTRLVGQNFDAYFSGQRFPLSLIKSIHP